MSGTLYSVATPIGNMDDMTLRAIEVLKKVDIIFAEDTRVTKKLCERFQIDTPVKSYHQRSGRTKLDEILSILESGEQVAVVTDAGTPGISDPGNELVRAVADTLPETKVEPIPGASSLTAALSVAGFPTNEFIFLGFLPHKKGRQTLLNEITDIKRTVVLFESPHRIKKLFAELLERNGERSVVVCRELTKLYESVYRGSVQEIETLLEGGDIPEKGEFVVILGPLR